MCIGQKQRWFLLRLKREDVPVRFHQHPEPEFDQWRWVTWWEPVREVIYFKRPCIRRALTELATFAFPDGAPPRPDWWEEVTAPASGFTVGVNSVD